MSPLLGDGVRIICTPPDVLEVTVSALFFDVDEAVELVRPAFEFDRTALPLEDAFLLLLLLWLLPPLTWLVTLLVDGAGESYVNPRVER